MTELSPLIEGLLDPSQRYETLRMIAVALKDGWQIPSLWKSTLPVELYKLIEEQGEGKPQLRPGDRLRAIEDIALMDKQNTDKLLALEKLVRLGDGDATERTHQRVEVVFTNEIGDRET